MTCRHGRTIARGFAPLLSLLFSTAACAQGFSALVSPPRFEDHVEPGTTYRNVLEINNVAGSTAHFNVRTADWNLAADGNVTFSDALAQDSCRPWVGIESAEVTLGANAKRRYRFEVAVPATAPIGECRFAIMIEGDPESVHGDVAIPVSGRIGVVVYLSVGEAAAKLEVAGQNVQMVDGHEVPVLSIRNVGNAHGRIEGLVNGKDASGRSYAFAPSTLPILPGEVRDIPLTPQGNDDRTPAPPLAYPVRLTGHLESATQRLDVETTFTK